MSKLYEIETKKTQKLKLWIYLLPVVGVIPSLWTLYRGQANSEQKKASRLSVVLLLLWLTPYVSLFIGAGQTSELLAFRLLYTNALLTTGYFLICLGLMFRLQQGKSPYLPLINSLIGTTKDK
ncbi:conserved membrane hypothetical protein [Hyella patelloides LEGE 07179]|uniref:Uncharacterized protein n=1 Tax=Hyella patelloides LEGE 07179 TaxID=945734 RepID=A0A563VK89_9CYAN|nr:hypothetical protein [Hyella patelloides]VEP11695.1 conserved membrane hypothetical protein [Hyella patelloides LEGE 07179]